MGQQPPAFDILAWNGDSTRMPAAMHSFYLRNCYVQNKFAKGELELARAAAGPGRRRRGPVRRRRRQRPHRAVDVLVRDRAPRRRRRPGSSCPAVVTSPASSTHRGPRRGSCPATSTRSPPKPGGRRPTRVQGSWWEDWAGWGAQRAGDLVDSADDGQRQPARPRRRPRRLRPHLTKERTGHDRDPAPTHGLRDGAEEAAQRIRELTEQFIESAKAAGNTSLDAYEQSLRDLVEFQERPRARRSWTGCRASRRRTPSSFRTSAPHTSPPRGK